MTTTKLTATAVGETLHASTCSLRAGVYTARWGFFYSHGRTAETAVQRVLATFPHAHVVDSGEVWKPFSGGAPTAKQSHWWVKFTLDGSAVVSS